MYEIIKIPMEKTKWVFSCYRPYIYKKEVDIDCTDRNYYDTIEESIYAYISTMKLNCYLHRDKWYEWQENIKWAEAVLKEIKGEEK